MNYDDRLNSLEKRIEELEKEVNELKYNKRPDRTDTKVLSRPVGEGVSTSVSPYGETKKETQKETIKKKETDWEHLIARVWLPRVFMFVLLIGLIWGFKAAVDGGLITEEMRCLLGLLAGGAFVYLGIRQHRQQRALLSQVLFAGSIGIFMLTTFAAHYLYGFINGPTALLLNVLWTMLGVWFSYQYKSQALGVLASITGILAPFLVESSHPSTIFFVSYEVLLYTSFMIFAMRQRYVILFYASFIFMHLAFMIFSFGSDSSDEWLAYGVLVQHILILGSILLKAGILKHQLRMLVTSFVLTALWFKVNMDSSEVDTVLLVFTLLYSALSVYFWKKKDGQALPFTLAVASYALLFFMMNRFESEAVVGFFIIEGFIALALGFVITSAFQKINGLLIYLLGCIAGLQILSDGMNSLASANTFIWVVLLLTLAGITALLRRYPSGSQKSLTKILYYGLGLLFLFFITDATTAVTRNVSENTQHLLISSAWVAYAISVIAYGLKKGIKQVRLAGIALLFLTLMKVIFFDLPTVSVVIKAVLFIGLGGIGVLLSRFFYRKE
ncbi:DUF2339 domain-containing protein [Paenibacillus sp. GD4]|uniref:DUF2339 domain-containing protein n=1 Tax=Paenibacillus sp. GD4 TaxID=3068890 RepID=UPI0027964B05|nr:DUF2339 domain-containing protein [Paenibacillus sp. GD4]MDQ1914237.1 DUF2339 domain-containing protein [Paenibacillus sp. GD4]